MKDRYFLDRTQKTLHRLQKTLPWEVRARDDLYLKLLARLYGDDVCDFISVSYSEIYNPHAEECAVFEGQCKEILSTVNRQGLAPVALSVRRIEAELAELTASTFAEDRDIILSMIRASKESAIKGEIARTLLMPPDTELFAQAVRNNECRPTQGCSECEHRSPTVLAQIQKLNFLYQEMEKAADRMLERAKKAFDRGFSWWVREISLFTDVSPQEKLLNEAQKNLEFEGKFEAK